jgi:hypothetical protein
MLPDTFCVFILTHGRPDNVITFKTLEKCGYTGRLYFVCDNEDKTVDQYIKNFGKDRVLIFDKKAEADECDEGNNFDERRTITMARNACFKLAKQVGVTHFVELDDDYSSFRYRYIDKYTTKGHSKILDRAFLSMLNFYKSTSALSVAFAQGGDFIGGEGCGMLSNYLYTSRKCMNSFFCATERPFKFIGAMNEDVNTYTTLGSRGNLFLTLPFIGLEQAATQTQKGGITDMYKRYGTYCKAFTTVMMMPSAVSVSMMGFINNRLHHLINWRRCVPCIINEKHKKKETNET